MNDPITAALRSIVREEIRAALAEFRATPSAATPEWLSIDAAAEHFDVSARSLADAGRRHEIETSRVGQKTVVRVASIATWIQKRAAQPANDAGESDPAAAAVAAYRARRGGAGVR